MTLAPFYAASGFIKAHIVAALVVVALTPLQFWGFRKGSTAHRATGYLWLGAMLVVAISSFFIPSTIPFALMGFGPVHLLSVLTLFSVYTSVRYARAGNVTGHSKTLRVLSISFWIAAALTLVPEGRIMAMIVAG
ncbi:MAG: hypothetical protein FD175_1152 [Beijerinckiaceae bacterium]|nr:MAG: hypothetical protein FD175_1152 [Beijerinckiaceae bacterium]